MEQPFSESTEKEIQLKRKEVAHTLMMFEGQMEGCCPCCGFITKPDEEPLVQCKKCRKLFHKKSHCVGEDVSEQEDITEFLCEIDQALQ